MKTLLERRAMETLEFLDDLELSGIVDGWIETDRSRAAAFYMTRNALLEALNPRPIQGISLCA